MDEGWMSIWFWTLLVSVDGFIKNIFIIKSYILLTRILKDIQVIQIWLSLQPNDISLLSLFQQQQYDLSPNTLSTL
jgi:hypothetical protein